MQLSLHLMLYCGIRPTKVSRIDPERDVDWEHAQVLVRPTTSKTGGGRVVPLRMGGCHQRAHDAAPLERALACVAEQGWVDTHQG